MFYLKVLFLLAADKILPRQKIKKSVWIPPVLWKIRAYWPVWQLSKRKVVLICTGQDPIDWMLIGTLNEETSRAWAIGANNKYTCCSVSAWFVATKFEIIKSWFKRGHFVFGHLCPWHGLCWPVWQKCTLCHEPLFSCSYCSKKWLEYIYSTKSCSERLF